MTEVEQCKLVERNRMLTAMLHWACLHDRANGGRMLVSYPTIAAWFALNSKNETADDLLAPMVALETIRNTYGWKSINLTSIVDLGLTALLQRQAAQDNPMTGAVRAVEATKQKYPRKGSPGRLPADVAQFACDIGKLADDVEKIADRVLGADSEKTKDQTLEEAAEQLSRVPYAYESLDETVKRIMREAHGTIDRACDKAKEPESVKSEPAPAPPKLTWTRWVGQHVLPGVAVGMLVSTLTWALVWALENPAPSRPQPTVPVTRASQSLTVAIKARDRQVQRDIKKALSAIDNQSERGRRVLFWGNKDDLIAQGRWERAIRDQGYAIEPWGKSYRRVSW